MIVATIITDDRTRRAVERNVTKNSRTTEIYGDIRHVRKSEINTQRLCKRDKVRSVYFPASIARNRETREIQRDNRKLS